jgi:CDP-glycerol glycerophosphotransferase
MPRLSVVVPVYDVEAFLPDCLASLARQTFTDFEVVMVDDGSHDAGAALAERFAARDPRFRLLTQPNGGLSRARNTGIDAATGEYLAFADSDDLLPPDAHERLLGSLEATGSDFATGNVQRLTSGVISQAAFVKRAFTTSRPQTHITRDRPLLADRTAWNKVFRRSFWDAHGLRFPDGRVHEDIPVILPAHFLATSVDVLAAPVYVYRARDEGELSITQRRLEPKVLRDRITAIEEVIAFLERQGLERPLAWYRESLVRDDLRLHLNVLDRADDAYRREFAGHALALIGGLPERVFADRPAIDRLKWHLLRAERLDDLAEVVRFANEDARTRRPIRRGLRWYGDFPFRGELPDSLYRLGRKDAELAITAQLDALSATDGVITARGRAGIGALGAPGPRSQKVRLVAIKPGRWQRITGRLAPLRFATTSRRAEDAEPQLAWTGFEATLDASRLPAGSWQLQVAVRSSGLLRRRARFTVEPTAPPATGLHVAGGRGLEASATPDGRATLRRPERWVAVREARLDGDRLAVAGELEAPEAALELVREADGRRWPLRLHRGEGRAFTADVDVADLLAAGPPLRDEIAGHAVEAPAFDLWVQAGGRRSRATLAGDAVTGEVLRRLPAGGVALVVQPLSARST